MLPSRAVPEAAVALQERRGAGSARRRPSLRSRANRQRPDLRYCRSLRSSGQSGHFPARSNFADRCSVNAAHRAHSLTSVAKNSWSQGAAMASDTPPACRRATDLRPAHPSLAPARSTLLRQPAMRASSIVASTTSSTAPVEAKNRLLPVRRRESSNGSSRGTFSRRSPAPSARRVRPGSSLRY